MPEYIYGIHPVEDLLSLEKRPVEQIWVQKGNKSRPAQNILDLARKQSIKVCFEDRKKLDQLVQGAKHQGVVARCGEKKTVSIEELLEIPLEKGEDPFFLILDRVEDPGNLGAVIRTAHAAGVHGLIIPDRGTAPLGATALKRSAGALERFPVARVVNLVRAMEDLKQRGIWVIGTHAHGEERFTDVDLSGPVALVVGGEKGLRRLVQESCDRTVSIPMIEGAESLNLSVAAALMIYEVVRQRNREKK